MYMERADQKVFCRWCIIEIIVSIYHVHVPRLIEQYSYKARDVEILAHVILPNLYILLNYTCIMSHRIYIKVWYIFTQL